MEDDFKTDGRNFNNLLYAHNIILVVENANDLEALGMEIKECISVQK